MRPRTTVIFLIALLAIMTLYPVLHSWYTTNDDVYNAMGIDGGWRSPLLFDARRSGRLVHVLAGQMMAPSYGYGSYWAMKGLSLGAILSNVVALALVLRLFTGDARLGLLAATFFFAFLQNTWDHNLLTAYPFTSTFAMTMFLLSVALWWTALHGTGDVKGWRHVGRLSRRTLVILSTACYATSLLIYESFLTYALVFPLLAMSGATSWKERGMRALRTPQLWALAVVVLMMVGFRVFLLTDDGRAMMDAQQYEVNLDPVAVGKVLERYTFSALPMHYFRVYRDLVNDYYLGFGSFRSRFVEIFGVFDMAWFVKAALVGWLTAMLVAGRTVLRHRGFVVALALVIMVLTHLPLAVSSKYQEWVLYYFNHGYMTSYLGFVGVAAFLAVAIDSFVGLLAAWHRALGRTAVAIVAAAAFVTSYGTDFLNAHVVQSQRQMYDKWQIMDRWIDSEDFRRLPVDSVVLAPTLWDVYQGQTVLWDDYWTRYVQQYGGKRVHMARFEHLWRAQAERPESAGKTYFLKFMRERRDDASYIVFGHIPSDRAGGPLASDRLSLLSHARSDYLRVIGRLHGVAAGCRARVFVNGEPSSGTFDEMFAVHADTRRPDSPWLRTELVSRGAALDPESIAVSQSSERLDGAIEIRYERGFLPNETAHRWAENEAELVLLNHSDRETAVTLQLHLRAPHAPPGSGHALDVSAGGSVQRWPIDDRFEKRSLSVTVPGRGSVPVTFKTTAPRIDPAKDVRNLVLMFVPPLRVIEDDVCAH